MKNVNKFVQVPLSNSSATEARIASADPILGTQAGNETGDISGKVKLSNTENSLIVWDISPNYYVTEPIDSFEQSVSAMRNVYVYPDQVPMKISATLLDADSQRQLANAISSLSIVRDICALVWW